VNPKTTQVIAEDALEVEEESTLESEEVSDEEMLENQPSDVEALKAEYEKKLANSSRDMSNLRSTLDKRASLVEATWQTRYDQLQEQLKEIRMSGMDDGQRKQYETQLAQEELKNSQNRIFELEQKNQEQAALFNAQAFFISQGVPVENLVLDQGQDALVNSGWTYLREEREQLKQALEEKGGGGSKKPIIKKKAPTVVTDKSPSLNVKTTWKALRDRYGSDETVYRMIESGQLSADILPQAPPEA